MPVLAGPLIISKYPAPAEGCSQGSIEAVCPQRSRRQKILNGSQAVADFDHRSAAVDAVTDHAEQRDRRTHHQDAHRRGDQQLHQRKAAARRRTGRGRMEGAGERGRVHGKTPGRERPLSRSGSLPQERVRRSSLWPAPMFDSLPIPPQTPAKVKSVGQRSPADGNLLVAGAGIPTCQDPQERVVFQRSRRQERLAPRCQAAKA